MKKYMIERFDDGCCIVKSYGDGRYEMWRSYDCKWSDDTPKVNIAWGAFLGFEDGFYPISEEEALEIIKTYEKQNTTEKQAL